MYHKDVGGYAKVRGNRTIKIRVVDDDANDCDLLIHNVMYAPECPTNLFSPQLWFKVSKTSSGTGKMTVGGTTLLFWDEHKYTKMVQHHPALKLPIFTANNGEIFNAILYKANFEQPKVLKSLNTSM